MNNLNKAFTKRPNFLIIMVDEDRFPPIYETSEIKVWRKKYLATQTLLRENGMEFKRHYTGSTACSPSRATIFTGQYPSLHGVSQTDGVAKGPFDADMFWLDESTVPTMGNYFRTAGYQTYYLGKWHISKADILLPGTHDSFLSYNETTGIPIRSSEDFYLKSERLNKYGFSGWIGPEPHGRSPHNSGSSAKIGVNGRDVVYASEAVELIKKLDVQKYSAPTDKHSPWLIVTSFVNPHDIAIFGALSHVAPGFEFRADDTIPDIPFPPTFLEDLYTKPRCQSSYRDTYGKALQPIINTPFYRRLYYQLMKNVDLEMYKVFESLKNSSFYEDTIIIFFSDHGELLGAHGGLHQKWHCAYEEAIHIPLIFHNPILFSGRSTSYTLTSHTDILPTMLSLAGIKTEEVQNILSKTHTDVQPLVGKDLSSIILGSDKHECTGEAIYFMTDDEPTKGLDQENFLGWRYNSVIQPNHIETVITGLNLDGKIEFWKYSRYFDNPQFWTEPGKEDDVEREFGKHCGLWGGIKNSVCTTIKKTQPVPDEIEMYNLTQDPLETSNLANSQYTTPKTRKIQEMLACLLAEQRRKKRLLPNS